MIKGIEVQGFKRFREKSFEIAPLTLLTGLNGSGKTTLIHALLLTWKASALPNNCVGLKDLFGIDLGTAAGLRNWESNEAIKIIITSEIDEPSVWEFGIESEDALYFDVNQYPQKYPNSYSGEPRAFTYLSAERWGPRMVLEDAPLSPRSLEIGVHGEYAAQLLATFGGKPLADKTRRHPDKSADEISLLKYEVERWLSEGSRPVEIDTILHPGSALTALRFRASGESEWVRAPNMGFGVSYALPIILAGLTALSGGILIVENPEAHLHPAGQSRMGVFLAWLAGCGVQVILETHSDHVLNGVRRAIGEYSYLDANDVIAHFFDSTAEKTSLVQQLKFSTSGSVSHWPSGFFDQFQLDAASLGRIRRRESKATNSAQSRLQ